MKTVSFVSFVLVLYLIFIRMAKSAHAYWWTVGKTNMKDTSVQSILATHKFSKNQRLLLKQSPELLLSIGKGAAMAIQECKRQFINSRWNCSDYSPESVFGKILQRACRETSFIYAITSAGATYALTEGCSKGAVNGCHCQSGLNNRVREKQDWIYEGCHDNIQYGYENGKAFTDAKETSRDFKALVNLHNNEAGRTLVVDLMKQECKCLGVSGNCNVKTCRRKLSSFQEIGNRLKELFSRATKVQPNQIFSNRRITRNYPITQDVENSKFKNTYNIVYGEESPNFCKHDLNIGSLGTLNRYCNATVGAIEGCEQLCCGRNWKTEKLTRSESCNCVFKWCCNVECQECKITKEYSFCK
ncbi:protein Wnt-1 isoform X4 [Hydra vulgaris]|uniref:Protein Wnt n=1 Tax=Hydra vulgaris TaxID=6087 RepID=A0ABM4C3H7_HYDVU